MKTGRYYVYRCLGADGQVLYVGCTGNLQQRLAQHRRKSWSDECLGVKVTVYADEREAYEAERAEIRRLEPTYNYAHNPSARPRERRSAEERASYRVAAESVGVGVGTICEALASGRLRSTSRDDLVAWIDSLPTERRAS